MVGLLCLAIGFGAGWAIFEQPWKGSPDRFTSASIEQATAGALGRRVRDVSCQSVHGPYYSCRAYTGPNRGADYDVTLTPNLRCLHATEVKLSPVDFEPDDALAPAYRGWLTEQSDCYTP